MHAIPGVMRWPGAWCVMALVMMPALTASGQQAAVALKAAGLPEEVGVASFNVWRSGLDGWDDDAWDEGTSRGRRVAEVIAKSGADVVGLQEYRPKSGDGPPGLAQMVSEISGRDWRWVDTVAGGLLTHLEVITIDETRLGARLRTRGGRAIWVVNVHIGLQDDWSTYYLPYAAKGGEVSAEELIRRARLNWAQPDAEAEGLGVMQQGTELFAMLDRLRETGEPIFLTGDFNEPSHLDWTADAVEAGLVPLAVAAPFSHELARRGLRDAYHVDRVRDGHSISERWGYTWTPGAHRAGKTADDDRIDFVMFGGPHVRVVDAETLGEAEGRWVDRSFGKWPSDHRAVLARFLLEPGGAGADGLTRAEELAATPREGVVRVLVWNIQRGANTFEAGAEKALAVIRAINPDVCLLQESYDIDGDRPTLGRWMAGRFGWRVHQAESPHLAVLTRWPIEERFFHEAWHGLGAKITDPEGRAFLAWSIWIDYRAYTPYALRDDPEATDADLLLNETERSGRHKQAEALLEHLREIGQLDGSSPLLVGGDWNCPSHLDWTPAAARLFRFRRALPLPVSRAMQREGFSDVFRVLHPDPARAPGITWSPLSAGKSDKPETADRIDRLYHRPMPEGRGPRLVPRAAWTLPLVPENEALPAEKRQFSSDHGAVVIDFDWR